MASLRSIGMTLYRTVLWLYPPAFQQEFAPEMLRDFCEASDEARATSGEKGVLALWARTAADALATIPAQWMRTGVPLVGAAALGPLIAAAGAAWLWPWRRMTLPPKDHPHFDIIVLEISVTTVLFIVVATILLTHWFMRRMFARRQA